MQLGRKEHGDQIGQFIANWATFGCPCWLCVKMKKPDKMVTFLATFCLYKFLTNNKKFQSVICCRYFKASKVVCCRCFGLSNWASIYILWPLLALDLFWQLFPIFGYFFQSSHHPEFFTLNSLFFKPLTVNKTLSVILCQTTFNTLRCSLSYEAAVGWNQDISTSTKRSEY